MYNCEYHWAYSRPELSMPPDHSTNNAKGLLLVGSFHSFNTPPILSSPWRTLHIPLLLYMPALGAGLRFLPGTHAFFARYVCIVRCIDSA